MNQIKKAPLTGKYAKLAEDLRAAAAEGICKAMTTVDDGTCNMDAATLTLPRWQQAKVEEAARAAGVGCFVWNLWGSKSYVFPLRIQAKANARTSAAEAMRDQLSSMGYQAGMYYQMD